MGIPMSLDINLKERKMGKIEKILTVLEAGDFTAKQIQQQTGIDNIHVLLWHLIKKGQDKERPGNKRKCQ